MKPNSYIPFPSLGEVNEEFENEDFSELNSALRSIQNGGDLDDLLGLACEMQELTHSPYPKSQITPSLDPKGSNIISPVSVAYSNTSPQTIYEYNQTGSDQSSPLSDQYMQEGVMFPSISSSEDKTVSLDEINFALASLSTDFINSAVNIPNVDDKDYSQKKLAGRFLQVFLHAFSYLGRKTLPNVTADSSGMRRYDLYDTVKKETEGVTFTSNLRGGQQVKHYHKAWDQVFRGMNDVLVQLKEEKLVLVDHEKKSKREIQFDELGEQGQYVKVAFDDVKAYCELVREFEKKLWLRLSEEDRSSLLNASPDLYQHISDMEVSPPRKNMQVRIEKIQKYGNPEKTPTTEELIATFKNISDKNKALKGSNEKKQGSSIKLIPRTIKSK